MRSCFSWVSKESGFLRVNTLLVKMLWCLLKWQQKCWRRLLRAPWTAWRSNQSVLREINPEYSLEGLTLKLQYFGHLMRRADSLQKTPMLGKIGSRGEEGVRDEMARWHHGAMEMNLSKLWEMVRDKEAWRATAHGVTKSQAWLSNWTTTVNITAQAAAEFKRIDSNFERSSTLGENAIQQSCTLQRNHLRREESVDGSKLHSCLILRNCRSHPSLQQPPPWSVSSH